MSRVEVTPVLAESIRTLRLDNKVPATSLAKHLGKSPSYISKLENGTIKSIARSELDEMIRFIVGDKPEFADQVDDILKASSYRYSDDELKEQAWFCNYSEVYCHVPIPLELVDEINRMMHEYGISREYLLERINSNEFLCSPTGTLTCDYSKYPHNEWFVRDPASDDPLEIFLQIELDELTNILEKKARSTRYIFLEAVVVYILKIKDFQEQIYIGDDNAKQLFAAAKALLNSYKFYSLSDKVKYFREPAKLSIHDQRAQEEIAEVIARLQHLSNIDVQYTNEKFDLFNQNLEWDDSFMLFLMAMPFNKLGSISYATKKELLAGIKELIQEAIQTPAERKKLDRYEFD